MRVLISGAGIAGPALALWLHRAGADVTVVERAVRPRPGGHAVDVRGVAREVVERMGLCERIREFQVDERGAALVDGRGRRLAEVPVDAFGGEGIVAEIEIARGDLARILLDATSADVRYRFGDRITALAQDGAGVDVTFAGGASERYDVVVGADGVHSGVRGLSFKGAFVRHLGAYSAYFTVPDPGDLDHWLLMYNAPGGRVAQLRPQRAGTAHASLSFREPEARFGRLSRAEDRLSRAEDRLSRAEHRLSRAEDRLSRAEQQRVLAERMAGAGWRVGELLAAMPAADDFWFDAISQVRVDRWWRGRVVLLGDAGYCGSPLAGMGTSFALVGACVLAGELAAAADPEEAFAAYQGRMAAYVAGGLELPPGGIRAFAPRSRAMIRLRALSMRLMTRWPSRQLLARQFAKAEAITLPDYASITGAP